MLSVNHLDLRFGEKYLFKDISVQVYGNNRIGLVGVNGAGKTTLLKIMAGVNATDDGVVNKAKNFTIGYLAQESAELFSNKTLQAEARSAFASLLALQQENEELLHQLHRLRPDSDGYETLVHRQSELQHRLDGSDLYMIDGKIEKVLLGLGFSREDMEKKVSSFSGGWQMRIKLAKMLLEEPSLLLLDEPTNHLDLESLTWVEQFLITYRGAMVIISHDRTFLDKVTELTWEISFGKLDVYKGNYSFYIKEKAERRAVEKGTYDNQQAKIRQTMRFVERFRAKSTKARQVQSRVKQLEKMELIELADEEQQIKFRFPPAPPSGRDVLQVENLSKSFAGKKVFGEVHLHLGRGDKMAVVGVNGAGKSTFLKLLAGQLEADSGEIKIGANVKITYFGQHQAQELSPQLSVLDTMALSGEDLTITRTRSLLGAFLFRGDDVEKKVAVLSGGEKSRLALAKMIATPANCMLLDEPTNHLDMSSQEVLQEAMAQYDGTIVVVSHNRYFVDSFVNKVLEVKNGHLAVYEGNVSEYLRKQEELKLREAAAATQPSNSTDASAAQAKGDDRKERKRQEAQLRQERSRQAGPWLKKLEEAEKQVEFYEQQKLELEQLMAQPELYADEKSWSQAAKDYEECKRRLDRWLERWESAQEKIDKVDAELGLARRE
jgi:ATP-binding cassette subfamily F protein 3